MIFQCKKGFTLTELSIVLTIIGILAAGSLSVGLSQTDNIREQQTLEKMRIIEEAITAFIILNKRLPCPANANLNIDLAANSSTYGVESFTGSVCSGTVGAAVVADLPVVNPPISDNNISAGSLPVQSLLMPKDLMLDGWGNKFTYVVTRGLANNVTNQIDNQEVGIIKIKNFTNPGGSSYVTDRAAYVLISHGKSGVGAWNRAGTRISNGVDVKKIENAHTSGGYNDTFVLNIPDASTNTFDDIVKYRTKQQIIVDAGSILSGQVCLDAYTALSDSNITVPADRYCNGTGGVGTIASSANCSLYMTMFAELIRKRCLPR